MSDQRIGTSGVGVGTVGTTDDGGRTANVTDQHEAAGRTAVPVLGYRPRAADARGAGDGPAAFGPSAAGGCGTTVAVLLVLVAATAWVGLRAFQEAIAPAAAVAAVALVGMGVARGTRRGDWGYLAGVALAMGGVAAFAAWVRWVAFQ